MGATNRFSEDARELQMFFLKPPEECTQISRRRRKAICCSHVVLEQLLALQQEGLGKSVKMLKHFARGKKTCLLNIK
jgi:predicted kinase